MPTGKQRREASNHPPGVSPISALQSWTRVRPSASIGPGAARASPSPRLPGPLSGARTPCTASAPVPRVRRTRPHGNVQRFSLHLHGHSAPLLFRVVEVGAVLPQHAARIEGSAAPWTHLFDMSSAFLKIPHRMKEPRHLLQGAVLESGVDALQGLAGRGQLQPLAGLDHVATPGS
jgi:hypothetical protein